MLNDGAFSLLAVSANILTITLGVDHQPTWKDRDLSGMDRKQVLDEYNKDVRLRCPGCNRADN